VQRAEIYQSAQAQRHFVRKQTAALCQSHTHAVRLNQVLQALGDHGFQ